MTSQTSIKSSGINRTSFSPFSQYPAHITLHSFVCALSAHQCCQLLQRLRHIHRQVRFRSSYQETCPGTGSDSGTPDRQLLGPDLRPADFITRGVPGRTSPPSCRLQNVCVASWNQLSKLPTSQHMVQ